MCEYFVCNALYSSLDGNTFVTMTHFSYFRCGLNLWSRTMGREVLINLPKFFFLLFGIKASACSKTLLLWGYRSAHFCHGEHAERLTCLEVGDDRAAGEGPFGSIQGHGVAGARLEVGQLVLLLVALDKEGVGCHWKVTVDPEVYNIYVISSIFSSLLFFFKPYFRS